MSIDFYEKANILVVVLVLEESRVVYIIDHAYPEG